MNLSDLLTEKRRLQDAIDAINRELSEAKRVNDDLERQILDAMTAQGMTEDGAKLTAGGITVTRKTKWRAKYEPEKWEAVHKWLVDSGYGYCIHRRMTDSKIMELVDSGVALPDGLGVESYTDLDFRRVG